MSKNPTPMDLIQPVASLLKLTGGDKPAKSLYSYEADPGWSILDPCAGDGSAVFALRDALFPNELKNRSEIFTIEFDKAVFKTLNKRTWSNTLNGDAFAVDWQDGLNGVSLVFLNPPNAEDKWLTRFTGALANEGVLVFLVPFHALDKCADVLAQNYGNVRCFKLPEPHFAAFKQVVLYAVRQPPLAQPNTKIAERVIDWSKSSEGIPVLPACGPTYSVKAHTKTGLHNFKLRLLDITGLLAAYEPWKMMPRRGKALEPVMNVLPEPGKPLSRSYPVVMPLKPAHIAAGIAVGATDGARVSAPNMPDVLLKGVFLREAKQIDSKFNKDGDLVGEVFVESPKLMITVLDLEKFSYHTLPPSDNETKSTNLATMTAADFILHYGKSLMSRLEATCPVLHDPRRDEVSLPEFARPLYPAQAHAVMAAVKLMAPEHRKTRLAWSGNPEPVRPYLLGEIGTGKSGSSLATAVALGSKRVLVVCPPHLLSTWKDQIREVLGAGMRVDTILDISDVDRLAKDKSLEPIVALVSRETAKLGHGYESIGKTVSKRRVCPKCGSLVPELDESELAKKRMTCEAVSKTAKSPLAKAAHDIALALVPVHGNTVDVQQWLTGRAELTWCGGVARALSKLAQENENEDAEEPVAEPSEGGRRVEMEDEVLKPRVTETLVEATPLEQVWMRTRSSQGFVRGAMLLAEYRTKINTYSTNSLDIALMSVLAAVDNESLTERVVKLVYEASLADRGEYGQGARLRDLARDILWLMPVESARRVATDLQRAVRAAVKVEESALVEVDDDDDLDEDTDTEDEPEDEPSAITGPMSWTLGGLSKERREWSAWEEGLERIRNFSEPEAYGVNIKPKNGGWYLDDCLVGTSSCALNALKELSTLTSLTPVGNGEPCGERLYQAVPSPRRYPVATYIARKHKKLFDFVIIDEAHEAAGDGSAQGFAAHRLLGLGTPALALTGTIMNGKASSLHGNHLALDPAFRELYPEGSRSRFAKDFGYRKFVRDIESEKKATKPEKGRGMQSDRQEPKEKDMGESPGVLPLFVLQELLPQAVVIHKADLDVHIPPMREIVEEIEPTPELRQRYERMAEVLAQRIKSDRFEAGLSGKLWSAMADVPNYLDLAALGNGIEKNSWVIRYPDSPDCPAAGKVVAREETCPEDELLPKEAWLVETVKRELFEGRKCLVFGWHSERGILERLVKILERVIGEVVPLLRAAKVSPDKREAWIDTQVIGKKRSVMVVNPVCVQTGLNNLRYFPTQIHMQNPAVNPTVYEQAAGRSYRIGQKLETRIYLPVYKKTLQGPLQRLLMHKVGVLRLTSGLDAATAMNAAGIGSTGMVDVTSVGRILYEVLTEGRVL